VASTPEPAAAPDTRLATTWLGRMEFTACLQLQLALRDAVASGDAAPTMLLVEHPPTLTLGRRGRRSDVLWSDAQLAERGVAIAETPRGGEVTLHAPGQLVAYPIVRIGWQVRRHITDLGEAAVELLRELQVGDAAFRIDHPGVWLGARKLASIGVHVSRGVTVQGIAINLAVERSLFGALVSCGMPTVEMASTTEVGGTPIGLAEAGFRYAEIFAARLGMTVSRVAASTLPAPPSAASLLP
jgi:lipoyl(octanoyl) transferase